MIRFTKHAEEKFRVLKTHKFSISKKQVIKTVANPEFVDYSRLPLLIVQRELDQEHVLRVVYKKENGDKIIITFYPGRLKQYGKSSKTKN